MQSDDDPLVGALDDPFVGVLDDPHKMNVNGFKTVDCSSRRELLESRPYENHPDHANTVGAIINRPHETPSPVGEGGGEADG